jgi:hypothetical protein
MKRIVVELLTNEVSRCAPVIGAAATTSRAKG